MQVLEDAELTCARSILRLCLWKAAAVFSAWRRREKSVDYRERCVLIRTSARLQRHDQRLLCGLLTRRLFRWCASCVPAPNFISRTKCIHCFTAFCRGKTSVEGLGAKVTGRLKRTPVQPSVLQLRNSWILLKKGKSKMTDARLPVGLRLCKNQGD